MSLDKLRHKFEKKFNAQPEYYVDTGGRFELLGNHTDHNHGLCLVANCSLRLRAFVSKETDYCVIFSEGFKPFRVNINALNVISRDYGSTYAILKGVLFKMKALGYKIGGFKLVMYSEIPDGSGVSSSAAIESLFGYIISYLYNDGKIPPLVIAQVGQFSENNYFHKPCGLLDQIGTAYNSCNFIDFKNIENPTIKTLPFNLPLDLFLIKSEGDHANLTPLYAAIPNGMFLVAELLGNKQYLRDCEDKDVIKKINELDVGESVKRKALHFFIENQNVLNAKKAIETNDVEMFLDAVRSSQKTSKENIENTYVKDEYEGSPQEIIDKVTAFLGDKGAVRIHGGGFKGTVLVFVKHEYDSEFTEYLKKNYKGKFFAVRISKKAFNFNRL